MSEIDRPEVILYFWQDFKTRLINYFVDALHFWPVGITCRGSVLFNKSLNKSFEWN